MNNALKITAVAATLALGSSMAMANENIAYVNGGYLIQNHPERAMLLKNIDAQLKAPVDALKKEQQVIVDKRNALEKAAPKLRSKEIKTREDAINALIQKYQKDARALQVKNAELQRQAEATIATSIRSATDKVAKADKYTYVLDANAIVYAMDGKDITKQVMDAIKAQPTAKK